MKLDHVKASNVKFRKCQNKEGWIFSSAKMLYLLYERTLVSKRPHHGKIPEWLQTRGKLLGKESI